MNKHTVQQIARRVLHLNNISTRNSDFGVYDVQGALKARLKTRDRAMSERDLHYPGGHVREITRA